MIYLKFRFATVNDIDLYYKWANDPLVRENSFLQDEIFYDDHVKWFTNKLQSNYCRFYLFLNIDGIPVGQVRIDKDNNETIIGLSIDDNFRGMSLGAKMIDMACTDYFQEQPDEVIAAYIKESNIASYKVFEKAGFNNASKIMFSGNDAFRLTKQLI